MNYFCQEIIAKELAAITSRNYANPGEWIFSPTNHPFGPSMPDAEMLQSESPAELRRILTHARSDSLGVSSNLGASSSDTTKTPV